MTDQVLKARFELLAEAKKFKEARQDAEKLSAEILELNQAYEKNVASSKEIRLALLQMTGSVKEGSEEFRILQGDLDRVNSIMLRQEATMKSLAREMGVIEDATQEEADAAQTLSETLSEQQAEQEASNRAVRDRRKELELSTKATEAHIVAEDRLVKEQEDSFIATKAETQALLQVATAKETARLETDEFATATGQAAQELQAEVRATKNAITYTKQKTIEDEAGITAMRNRAAVTDKLARQEDELGREMSETTKNALASREAHHRLLVEQKMLAAQTTILGISMDDLKKSLITAVAAGGVAGLVFKGMELIGDGFRRMKDAAVEFQREATRTFSELQEEVARTKAQIPDLIASQEQLYEVTVRTARGIGRAPVETATAMRKAQNLGLSYQESLEAVAVSTDAARVANADMTETLITGMTTVNAYGRGMYTINDVLDQYAYLTQNSNLETQDLISGMAAIISPAAEAGVSLEEVVAAMITMNRQGDDFQEIAALLGNMLTQLAVRGTTAGQAFEDAAGMGFREFTAAGGTLIEGLQLIENHADETEQSISELVQGNSKFYRDMMAGRGVLELTGRHTGELAEAYSGTQTAMGSLNKQTEEFQGTLYLANEEMEAAKEAAWAMEGSLTQGAAKGWVNFKKDLYDIIYGLSEGTVGFNELNDAIKESGRADIGVGNVRTLISPMIAGIEDLTEAEYAYNDLQREAARLLSEKKDISLEMLQIELERYWLAQQDVETERTKEIQKQEAARARSKKILEQERENLKEITKLEREEAEELEKVAAAEEHAAIAAEHREAMETRIKERLQAQVELLTAAYKTSQNYIQNISDLQLELAEEEDLTAIDDLTAKLEEAGAAIDEHYRKSIVDAMLANYGYSESIVDLAVELGLITEEAGELQKEFVNITTELEQLAEIPGFEDLHIREQAEAAEALANGIARSAEEAFAMVDPNQWMKEMPQGAVRAELEAMDVVPSVEIPQEDLDELTEFEGRIRGLVDTEWITTIAVPPEKPEADAAIVEDIVATLVRDRTIMVGIQYRGGGGGGGPLGMASGGSFTVPQGFMNDDYLIGVSSGEQVSVTSPGAVGFGDGGGDGTISIELIQHFDSGFAGNPSAVGAAARDGLYEALEKAGVV